MLSKVYEVFTKDYKEETKFREFIRNMLPHFKLKDSSEIVEETVKRLSDKEFVSNFHINVGKY